MDFEDQQRLDPSQISDVRGRRGPGLAIGGGAAGLVTLVLALVFGFNPADLGGGGGQPAGQGPVPASDLAQRCRTGADAERYEDCAIVAVVNSVQTYWTKTLGSRYRASQTQLFTGSTSSGCGNATSAVGPFYCPADETIYLDLGFFEVMKSRLGAQGGEFSRAYVVAHEYGHHVQDILGTSDRVQRSGSEEGPKSGSVRLELQADCYAGAWAANASRTGFITRLSEADIADGLDAAAAVGDDRIQSKSQGRVDPESWTHGSAEQRQTWFTKGFDAGHPRVCDTFATDAL